jgi:hypothetical protein
MREGGYKTSENGNGNFEGSHNISVGGGLQIRESDRAFTTISAGPTLALSTAPTTATVATATASGATTTGLCLS